MLAGELYLASDPQLVAMRRNARRLTRLFNATTEEQTGRRAELIRELFGSVGPRFEIEPDFRCDYGCHIHAGDNLFINFGCVMLDCARITLGSNVLIGPGVHFYAATHPTDPFIRATGQEYAKPITVGSDVWIGGHATICPGVTIGDGVTIGAGAVVTRDVPPGAVVVGNPARPVRRGPVS
ncbi:MAG: Maltose O-acetyltransferase [Phycisphaerales bacterium]|nr:Maltose O-acetyltransferase [Phycisphaerales bacterium]